MLKLSLAAGVLLVALPAIGHAACTPQDALNKSSDISEILMTKIETKTDEASKIMSDLGEATGTGAVTEQTCVKLDALLARAKKL